MICGNCGTTVLPYVERCQVCSADVGFPNVRAAEEPDEVAALNQRVMDAQTTAAARGAGVVLDSFGVETQKSQAVLARPLGNLDAFVKSDNMLYNNFHSQVRSGTRIPENNDWDAGRIAAENTINPHCYDKINYAALSLDGFGVLLWGDYSMTLKQQHILNRTSVFEENPFLFCERHRIIAGKGAPSGYRAVWSERHKLAVAKLVGKILPTTEPKDYASILLDQATSRGTADFVECHIYGPLHRQTLERVIGPKPSARADKILWKSVARTLRRLGAIVEEV